MDSEQEWPQQVEEKFLHAQAMLLKTEISIARQHDTAIKFHHTLG